jgi:hypothetical protein
MNKINDTHTKEKKPTYNTVLHRAREKLGLNIVEYCIADIIYILAGNPSSFTPGWANNSKEYIADCLGISQRTVFNCLNKLLRAGLVERGGGKPSMLLRTTAKWYDCVKMDKEDIGNLQSAKSAEGMQDLHSRSAKSAEKGCAKFAYNNNTIHNNKYNETAKDIFAYFCLKTKKSLKLTPERLCIIQNRLTEGYSLDQLKLAVDNFVQDPWPDRHQYFDLIYCLGQQRGKPDALDKWLNCKPKQAPVISLGQDEKLTDAYFDKRLGKDITKNVIYGVLAELPEESWGRLNQFLRKKYPAYDGRLFQEVEAEVRKKLQANQKEFRGLLQGAGK